MVEFSTIMTTISNIPLEVLQEISTFTDDGIAFLHTSKKMSKCTPIIWEGKHVVIERALQAADGNIHKIPPLNDRVHKSIRTLTLDHCTTHPGWFDELTNRFSSLQAIYLKHCDAPSTAIHNLKKCKNLTTLSITHDTAVTDEAFEKLTSLRLISLTVFACSKLTNKSVELFGEHFKALKKLDVSLCPNLTDQAMQSIAKLQALEELTVTDRMLSTAAAWNILHTLPNLRKLSLNFCNHIDATHLQALRQARPDIEIEQPFSLDTPPPPPTPIVIPPAVNVVG